MSVPIFSAQISNEVVIQAKMKTGTGAIFFPHDAQMIYVK
jgi:hypothetical protein